MGYPVRDSIVLTPTTVAATTYAVSISSLGLTLVDDDYVALYVHAHATTGTLSIAGSGWSELVELDVTSGGQMAVYIAKVASGTVSDPTITDTTSSTWQVVLEQWRDVDTTTGTITTDFAEVPTPTQANATSVTSPTFTPAAADSTIVYFGAARGNTGQNCRFLSDKVVASANPQVDVSTSSYAMAIGTVQQAAAAATAQTMYAAESARLGCITFAVKNKSGGKLSRDCRAAMTKVGWFGNYGTAHESLGALTFNAPSTFCVWSGGTEAFAGIDVATAALTPTHTTVGLPPLNGRYTDMNSATSTAGQWVGVWWATPSTLDMTGKIFTMEWFMATLGDAVGEKGAVVAFGDDAAADTGNAAVFQLAPKLQIPLNTLQTSHIAVETATQLAAVGSINWATINKIGIFYHRAGSNTNNRSISWRNMFLHGTSQMTGGNATRPLNGQFLGDALNGWGYTGLCAKSGDAMLAKTSFTFGDGAKATHVDTTATLINTPAKYSVNSQALWNVPANTVTIGVNGASGDTYNFKASAIAAGAGAEQNFTVTGASGATVSTQGGVFSNLLWTGTADFDPTGATYSGCDEVAWGGATVTNCTVSNTTSSDAAASVDANTTITTTTIDGTGALYALELKAAVTAVTLADCTLTAGSTDKVHVKATTGTVEITISGTTSLIDTDVTTDGATVDIVAPQPTLDAVVLTNTRALLWNRTTSAELDNTFVAGTSWSKVISSGASSGDVLDLYAFKEGYAESVSTIIYSGADATFAVEQSVDAAVAYYRTQESITDYTTLTEFNFYSPDIYIQADDADGESTLKKLFIFYNGVLTTADGATYMRGGVTFRSAFDVVINRSVRAIAVDNVSVTHGLHFTDEDVIRVTTDDGTSWIAAPSAPGSIRYAFGVAPGQIETGVSGLTGAESTQLMGLPSSTAIAAAVWAYVVEGSTTALQWVRLVASVLLGKVSGAGTGTETFRDLADTKDRVVSTVDNDGNRTAVARDGT